MALSNAERQKLHREKLKAQISNPLRNDEELKEALNRAFHSAYWRKHNPDFANCCFYQDGVQWAFNYIQKELGIDLGPYRKPGKSS